MRAWVIVKRWWWSARLALAGTWFSFKAMLADCYEEWKWPKQ